MSETLLGSVPLVNSTASIVWVTPLTGSSNCPYQICDLRAVYSGDAADNLSTSPDVVATLQKGDTSTTFTSTPNPSGQGQNVTFTATVTPSNVTGSFFVYNGSTQIGTYPVTSGAATFTISNLAVGSNALSARYSGSFSYNSSTGTLTQVVQPSTTTTLTSSPNPSIYGAAVILTAAVSPAAATGTVQFYNGPTLLGSAVLANGQAQLTTSSLPTGSDSLMAIYSGDANDAGSTSAALVQTVSQATSSTTVAANPATASAGQTVTLTATVAPATATGTVQILDGATVLGTTTIGGGSASLMTSTLSPGLHSITAVYSGDSNYSGSTSGAASVTVSKVTTTIRLTASPNPAMVGQNVTLSATVSPVAATGTVQFLDGATILGTASVSGGTAAFSVSTLTAGSHSLTAAYSGDALDAASTSAAVAMTVNKAASGVTLAGAPNPSNVGMTVTLTATMTPASATGTVQFLDGGVAIGTVAVNGGTAVFSTTALAAGSHSIAAAYSGDGATNPSMSAAVVVQVRYPTTTTLTSSPNLTVFTQQVSLTATVSAPQASGTVQFYNGAALLGSATIVNGQAFLGVLTLPVGVYTLTAVYGGDATFAGSTSAAVQQRVAQVASTTTLSATPAGQSVVGETVTFTATVAPAAATGSVQFRNGNTTIGTAALVNGIAMFSTSALKGGNYSITAAYLGDSNVAASTSAKLAYKVKP